MVNVSKIENNGIKLQTRGQGSQKTKNTAAATHLRCSVKWGVLKKFAHFTRKHVLESLPTQVFPYEICEISKNTHIEEHCERLLLDKLRYYFFTWYLFLGRGEVLVIVVAVVGTAFFWLSSIWNIQNIKTTQCFISNTLKADQMPVNAETKKNFTAWACNLPGIYLPVQSQGQKH